MHQVDMSQFKKLLVWQEARELVKEVYEISKEGDFQRDFGLTNQMRRAAISIVSNIAEGDRLNSNAQSVNHFYHARASAAELQTQLIIANDIGYLSKDNLTIMEDKCEKISAMLNKLISVRKRT